MRMRTVGHRTMHPITFSAAADLLAEGARFTGGTQKAFVEHCSFIPKGVYHFKTHEDANKFDFECLTKRMAEIAFERS
jgi:hypothetical protein